MYFPYSFWNLSSISLEGLISYYRLENNGLDEMGINNLSNNGSPAYSAGRIGNALRTTDPTVYLSSTSTDFQITTNKTFVLWFQSNEDTVDYFFTKYSGDPTFDYEYYIGRANNVSTFDIQFGVFDSVDNIYNVDSQAGFIINTWHLIITWIDLDNLKVWIQVDNDTPKSVPFSGTLSNTNTPFILGGNNISQSSANNTIDEVSIWNRILTPIERNFLWNNGRGISLNV